jgi:hypothetical protein
MKMTFFWDVAPCSLEDVDRHFRGPYCLHYQGDLFLTLLFRMSWCSNYSCSLPWKLEGVIRFLHTEVALSVDGDGDSLCRATTASSLFINRPSLSVPHRTKSKTIIPEICGWSSVTSPCIIDYQEWDFCGSPPFFKLGHFEIAYNQHLNTYH